MNNLNIYKELFKEYESKKLPNAILIEGERFSSKRTIILSLAKKILGNNNINNNKNLLILSNIDATEAKAYLALKNEELINKFLSYIKNILYSKYNFCSDKNLKKIEKNINFINEVYYKKDYSEKIKNELIKNIQEILNNTNFNVQIDDIRKIQTWIFSEKGKNKVIYINQIENLSINVFNSLLKILEEPPSNIYFILSSRNKNKIPKTILSRLRIYRSIKSSKKNEIEIFKKAFKKSENLTIEEYFNLFRSEKIHTIQKKVQEIINIIENKEGILNIEKFEFIKDEHDFKIFLNEIITQFREKYLNNNIGINQYIKFLNFTNEIQKNIVFNQNKKSIIENLILNYEDEY